MLACRLNAAIALVYVLAGIVPPWQRIIYTARLGQAKADAGTGYELFAITAVVLGGTSIFGGTGSVHGTLLGVAAIAVLNNATSSRAPVSMPDISSAPFMRMTAGSVARPLFKTAMAATPSSVPCTVRRRRKCSSRPARPR